MPGTPFARHNEVGERCSFPASPSSLNFFNTSRTQGIRIGLVRSATRRITACPPPFPTKGCAGSQVTGPGPEEGRIKSLWVFCHAAPPADRSGILFEGAAASANDGNRAIIAATDMGLIAFLIAAFLTVLLPLWFRVSQSS